VRPYLRSRIPEKSGACHGGRSRQEIIQLVHSFQVEKMGTSVGGELQALPDFLVSSSMYSPTIDICEAMGLSVFIESLRFAISNGSGECASEAKSYGAISYR